MTDPWHHAGELATVGAVRHRHDAAPHPGPGQFPVRCRRSAAGRLLPRLVDRVLPGQGGKLWAAVAQGELQHFMRRRAVTITMVSADADLLHTGTEFAHDAYDAYDAYQLRLTPPHVPTEALNGFRQALMAA